MLVSFPTVIAALDWKERREVGFQFPISDRRAADSPERMAELPVLIAGTIREALIPAARATQYDRLLSGESARIPADPFKGLEGAVAIFGSLCLEEAGARGWSAVQGVFTPPRDYLSRNGGTALPAVKHAWMSHEDGAILDLGRSLFKRSPVTFVEGEDAVAGAFTTEGPVLDSGSLAIAVRWIDELGGDLIPLIRHMGCAQIDLVVERAPEAPEVSL